MTETNKGFWQSAELMRRKDLTLTAKVLYGKICDFDYVGYGSSVSQVAYAEMMGVSERTIYKAVKDLESARLIYRDKKGILHPADIAGLPEETAGRIEQKHPAETAANPEVSSAHPAETAAPSKHEVNKKQEHTLSQGDRAQVFDVPKNPAPPEQPPKRKRRRKAKPKPEQPKTSLEQQQDQWIAKLIDAHPNQEETYKAYSPFRKLIRSQLDWVMCWIAHKDCLASEEWQRYIGRGKPELCGQLVTWLGSKIWIHRSGEYKQRALAMIERRKELEAQKAVEAAMANEQQALVTQ